MSNLYKQIWDELSIIDVSEHIEKKGNLSYLSWAWAYGTLMKYYPNNSYSFSHESFADGTMMVECMLTIHSGNDVAMRSMWLPVLDYKNQPIANPNAFQINTARMRCLVKCISQFGLGHYIYAGEDLPEGSKPVGKAKPIIGKNKTMLRQYIVQMQELYEQADGLGLLELDQELQQEDTPDGIYDAIWRVFTNEEQGVIRKLMSNKGE